MIRTIAAVLVTSTLLGAQASKKEAASPLQINTLLQTDKAWDGTAYQSYPTGRAQLSVLQITIPPNTTMEWHRHPIPNAAYVVNGNLKVETQDGKTAHYTKGQVVAETVGVWHRGVTTDQAADLLVFYAGVPNVPLSEPQAKPAAK
jgi:quercetin dioxygenase-like cupin family protein